MKRNLLLSFVPAILLLGAAIAAAPSFQSVPITPSVAATPFDTALAMLREFVAAGDHRLGFADTNEMNGAYINTNEGIPMYYALQDSFEVEKGTALRGLLPSSSHGLVELHRKIFPIFANGRVRSAIAFDSSKDGWRPIQFDNGALIRKFVEFIESDPRAAHGSVFVEAPFMQGNFLISKDASDSETVVLESTTMGEIKPILALQEHDSTVIPLSHLVHARVLFRRMHR
jgi:hypothetical protein